MALSFSICPSSPSIELNQIITAYQSDSNDTVGRGQYIVPPSQCGQSVPADKFCQFDVKSEILNTECSPSNSFGYKDGKPCVLIKLNRVRLTLGWELLMQSLFRC